MRDIYKNHIFIFFRGQVGALGSIWRYVYGIAERLREFKFGITIRLNKVIHKGKLCLVLQIPGINEKGEFCVVVGDERCVLCNFLSTTTMMF